MNIKLTPPLASGEAEWAALVHGWDKTAEWRIQFARPEPGLRHCDPHFRPHGLSEEVNRAAYDRIDLVLRQIRNWPSLLPSEAECAADEYDGGVSVEEWLEWLDFKAATGRQR